MKGRGPIWFLLVVLWVACTPSTKVPVPEVAGHGRSVEGLTPKLSAIDSLMWQRPDSALAVLLDYLDNDGRDVSRNVSENANDTVLGDVSGNVSTNETFNNHYAQLLASELLFKNDYAQTNRAELLQAVAYFDSIVDLRRADTRGVSLRPDPRRDAPRMSAPSIPTIESKYPTARSTSVRLICL